MYSYILIFHFIIKKIKVKIKTLEFVVNLEV